ncbi:MAG: hypothetical protein IPP34_12695 [Bacteroidetes bacterium]|nr:hypothetical protein [Bacteroidota bacterium]
MRLLLLYFLFFPLLLSAQQDSIAPITSVDSIETILPVDSIQQELNFIAYLNNRGENRDALLALKRLTLIGTSFSAGRTDTVNFFTAWNLHQLRNSDSAIFYFDRISVSSGFYDPSFFYGVLNRIYSKRYDECRGRLMSYDNKEYQSLTNLNLAALALLEKDLLAFDSLSKSFDYSFYAISEEQKSLKLYADTLRNYPKRSAVVAGVLSAIIPGAGKVYSGKLGQGLAAFLEIAALGGATAEYYFRSGPESAGFIIFGTLFSLFYVGNIWGSALSVHVNRNDFYQRIDNNIMVDLHIPLRRIFR